jgi:hypothetical protein
MLALAPVNSSVGHASHTKTDELKVTKQGEGIRKLNAHVQRAAQQLIQRERNELTCHPRGRMLLSILPAALIRALDSFR